MNIAVFWQETRDMDVHACVGRKRAPSPTEPPEGTNYLQNTEPTDDPQRSQGARTNMPCPNSCQPRLSLGSVFPVDKLPTGPADRWPAPTHQHVCFFLGRAPAIVHHVLQGGMVSYKRPQTLRSGTVPYAHMPFHAPILQVTVRHQAEADAPLSAGGPATNVMITKRRRSCLARRPPACSREP